VEKRSGQMDYQRNQLQHGLKMRTENQTIGRLFYLLAALQILIISGGAILGLLVAPASLFVSQTENEAFVWIALGFVGLANVALGVILILLSIVAAIGFRNEKKWRKIVGIIAAGLAILEFPFGTILGGYLVWKIINRKKN
jgi:uncharacterized Tic20 family protein